MRGILLLVVCAVPVFSQTMDEVDRLWRARGLQAMSKMDSLVAAVKRDDTMTNRVRLVVESGYMLFADPKNSVIRQTDTSVIYHLMLNLGRTEDDKMTIVSYLYDRATGAYSGVRIQQLTHGIHMMVLPDMSDAFMLIDPLNDEFPALAFSTKNPLHSFVLDADFLKSIRNK